MPTLRVICFAMLATSLAVGSAYSQNDSKPLNMTLPPSIGFPAVTATPVGTASGSTNTASASNPNDATDSCAATTDTKPKPQVHGSVSTGVVAGNHVSGNYQAATVNITQPLGDCEHPKGTLSITAHVSKSRFGYRGSH